MGITIGGWVGVGTGIVCLLIAIGAAVYLVKIKKPGAAFGTAVLGLVVCAAIVGGVAVYSRTEGGKRAYKDQESNFSGGIKRTVTVYDVNGNVIKWYSGEFDVETGNADYILFDDQNGKRHIIYYTTGTIIIDEE